MHPDDHQFQVYLEGKLSEPERQKIEAHTARCERCTHQFASLVRLERVLEQEIPFGVGEAALRKAVEIAGSGESWIRSNLRFLTSPFRIALAGAAVVAIAVGTYLLVPHDEPAKFRSDKTRERPAFQLHPADGTIVHEKAPQFRWSSIGRSAAYRFSLLEQTGVALWSNDVRDTSISLPPSVVLQPGITYLWRVETFFADKTLGRSALHAFTYAPEE